jgi:hypothetical protein
MRLRIGKTTEELAERERREMLARMRRFNWHPFFAVWPRKVADGDYRAFQWLERRRYVRRSIWAGVGGMAQGGVGVEYRVAPQKE